MPSKPAARSTDTTTHLGNLAAGSPTVKVNGQDAIRLSDPHACPETVPLPHVGGVVRFGTGAGLTVLINRKPATAIGGELQCAVPIPNAVSGASGNVYYDITNTLAGLPVTQDANGDIHIGDRITIKSVRKRDIHANGTTTTIEDDDYVAHVLGDLAKIASTDIGKQRLQSLDASGKNVNFIPNSGASKNAYSAPVNGNDAVSPAFGGTGKGTDVNIEYTPEEWPPDPRAETTTTGAEGDVVLFHEMNHADHQTHGQVNNTSLSSHPDPKMQAYDDMEEYNSIEPDENTYRTQRGFKERHTHAHN